MDELRVRASLRWRRVTWTVTILFFAMVLVSAAISGSVPWVLLLQANLFMLGAASLSRSVLQLSDEGASVQTLLRTRHMRWEHVAVLVAEPRRWSGAASAEDDPD